MEKYNFLQLLYEMVNDINRYPLPICFDPYEEQSALFRRQVKLEQIAKRFIAIQEIKSKKLK
jgi:hypothetical protein